MDYSSKKKDIKVGDLALFLRRIRPILIIDKYDRC